ncbi:hypothetical protein ZWY2020_005442 [Hordeum vulgare]|nr:hypothetical protein ZWY2020_005442 [Hordeum vulgare]
MEGGQVRKDGGGDAAVNPARRSRHCHQRSSGVACRRCRARRPNLARSRNGGTMVLVEVPVNEKEKEILHPPRLLGFYVSTRSTNELFPVLLRPRFVPMLPQPPELGTAVCLVEAYSLDAYDEELACIFDCHNDTILFYGLQGKKTLFGVHWPLCPDRGVEPPMTPYEQLDVASAACACANFLLKEEGDGKSLTFIKLSMGYLINDTDNSMKYKAHIYMLQDGLWHWHSSAEAVLPSPRSDPHPLLSGNKIYMEHSTSIAALDLTTSDFSTIPLPEGMERYVCEDMMMSQANDSGIYLIYLEKLQLRIWLHKGDSSGSMRNWLVFDTICLRDMLDAWGMADGEKPTLINTSQMGDDLQFVFLKMGQCALYLDIKHREMRKVYEVTEDDRTLERIYPFMMTWPPTFPVLKNDPASDLLPRKPCEKASSQVLTSHSSRGTQEGWKQFHYLVSSRNLLELGGLHYDLSPEFLIRRKIIHQTWIQQQIPSYILMCPF